MFTLLSWIAQTVFLLVVACFALYLALELRVLFISRRVERQKLAELAPSRLDPLDEDFRPKLSVLLPVCNESSVVERLIDAACRLRYPAEALEILVLDDSSDSTSALARAKVDFHAARGVDIRLIQRQERKSYKAGNLIHGIEQSSGEFLAIFDADFVPPEDFLLRTLPCFKDSRLGFLQTGIGYENRDASFLTRFQAMEMGHQQYVTVGLSEDGNMASLSGSSCVWRRSCVEALGGWNAATVTEDVDIGYRAQLGDWKYAYLRDVVSMSVLPETVGAVRVQRERWGRGLIHSAFKHVRQMFRQPMPLMKRLHAIAMMFSSALLASIYVLVLLTLPLNYWPGSHDALIRWGAPLFFALVTVWALGNAFGARKGARLGEMPGIARTLWDAYRYVALFLPMSWYYFAGGVRALFGVYGDFHRTPKGKDEQGAALPRINAWLQAGEIFTFAYSALALLLACQRGNYHLILMNFTVCVGFGMVLYWSWQERAGPRFMAEKPRRILITGATGAIGAALAESHAQPGATLYLHGRDEARLAEVAKRCAVKGARVETRRMDLRDFPALQEWLESLGALDLAIINAGMNTHVGLRREPEPWEAVESLLDVNLKASLLATQTLLPAMRARGGGQIALVSSLAAYFGLPVTPAYCASKAGLKAYGEALRGLLAPEGIKINVIMPGYVKSPMCDDMPGPKPFLLSPERAARRIRQGLERNEARIAFPFPLNWGSWWLAALPAALSTRIVRWLGYGI